MIKVILYLCTISLLLTSCGASTAKDTPLPVIISTEEETNNKSENCIDDIIFLGESTTYHLKSRGVLNGGKETKQVWAPKSGTLMLDATICECRIVYPKTNEELALEEALKREQPKIMLLTFGLNGATNFISRKKEYFKLCYQKLIDLIKTTSPKTKIIINSCFPIAANMDMSRYSIDAKTLNSYIDTLNIWAEEVAYENNINYANSASKLKDSHGYLNSTLQAEDGYHLNIEAYKLILEYLNNYLQSNKEN